MKNPLLLVLALCLAASAQEKPRDLSGTGLQDVRSSGAAPEAQQGVAAEDPKAAPPKPEGVDLKAQFADPSNRDQCNVGSCHAFSSIAVLEAAYFRQYGERVHLSEADIFLQRTVLSGDVYSDFCAEGKCKLSEGNDVPGDVGFAIEHGVASSLQYDSFLERYRRYRSAEQKTMEGLQKTYEQESWLEKLLYDPRKHWRELQAEPRAKRILEMYLKGSDAQLAQERADNKAKLAGFKVQVKEFKYLGNAANKLKAQECKAKGVEQKKAFVEQLKASQPLSVSMSLSGLKAWGQTDTSEHANHAFTVIGYEAAPGGVVLKTRNSWGGDNPDVREDELCRVYKLVAVRAPKDK